MINRIKGGEKITWTLSQVSGNNNAMSTTNLLGELKLKYRSQLFIINRMDWLNIQSEKGILIIQGQEEIPDLRPHYLNLGKYYFFSILQIVWGTLLL